MSEQQQKAPFLAGAKRTYSKMIDLQQLNRTVSWKLDVAAKHKRLAEALLEDRLELEACPICQRRRFHLFVEVFHYPYCECADCGHIFSQKPPRPEAIKALYAGTDKDKKTFQAEIHAVKELFPVRVKKIAAPKVQYVTGHVSEKGKWVDIGCGVGEIVAAANDQKWQALGIEGDPEDVDFARKMGVNVKEAFITQQNASEDVGDAAVVSLFNVLEHLIAPQEFLKAVTDAVSPGTHIVIEVPRHPSLSSFANHIFPHMAARHIYPPDHLHIFTEKSIGLVLKTCNLAAENVWLFGQDFYEIISGMAAKGGCSDNTLLKQILGTANHIQEAVDQSELSDTMIIISRRL